MQLIRSSSNWVTYYRKLLITTSCITAFVNLCVIYIRLKNFLLQLVGMVTRLRVRRSRKPGSFPGRPALWRIQPSIQYVKLVRNVMAHARKQHFFFLRNGRVHLNRWGRQFSRLLAAEVCASAWVMLDVPRSEVAWEYWLPTPFASFPFTSPPVRHRVPSGSARALLQNHVSILAKSLIISFHYNIECVYFFYSNPV